MRLTETFEDGWTLQELRQMVRIKDTIIQDIASDTIDPEYGSDVLTMNDGSDDFMLNGKRVSIRNAVGVSVDDELAVAVYTPKEFDGIEDVLRKYRGRHRRDIDDVIEYRDGHIIGLIISP